MKDTSAKSQWPRPNTIIWDMDSTLTAPSKFAIDHQLFERTVRDTLRSAEKAYQTLRIYKNLILPDLHLSPTFKRTLLNSVAEIRPDTKTTLSILGSLGVKQGLLSNNSNQAVGDRFLDQNDIRQYFSAISFWEHNEGASKPDPKLLKNIADNMHLNDDDVIWVAGDSARDMQLAFNAQSRLSQTIIPVAVGHQSNAHKFLSAQSIGTNSMHLTIHCPSDILQFIISSLSQE